MYVVHTVHLHTARRTVHDPRCTTYAMHAVNSSILYNVRCTLITEQVHGSILSLSKGGRIGHLYKDDRIGHLYMLNAVEYRYTGAVVMHRYIRV